VGQDKFNCQGSFGSHLFLDIVAFHCWDAALEYLRSGTCLHKSYDDKGYDPNIASKQLVQVIGILGSRGGGEEIFCAGGTRVHEDCTESVSLSPRENGKRSTVDQEQLSQMQLSETALSACLPEKSYPIHTRPFSTHTCFLVSKNRNGLPKSQARFCNGFVHIPHLDIFHDNEKLPTSEQPIPTYPLLDTATTFSIVLHHFTAWAGYSERQFEENQKFVKDDRPSRVRYLGVGKNYKKEDNAAEDGDDDGQYMNMAFWKSEVSSDY